MTKLNRALTIVLALQLGIILVGRLFRHKEGVQPRTKLFTAIDAKDVDQLKVKDGEGKSVTIKRVGDGWVLASGGDYPVTLSKVNEALAKLPGLEAEAPVTTKPEHYRTLEVADTKFQRLVDIALKGGKSLSFYLGTSPGVKKVHVRMASDKPVYLVSGLSSWDFGVLPNDWVDTEYFKVDKDSLVELRLTNKNGNFVLKRPKGGEWALEGLKPKQAVKNGVLASLVGAASAIMLHEPVGTAAKPEYGLDKPEAVLVAITETSAAKKDTKPAAATGDAAKDAAQSAPVRKEYRFVVGTKSGDDYFAKSDASPYIIKLATWNADTFVNKKLDDFLKTEEKKDDAAKKPAMPTMPAAPAE